MTGYETRGIGGEKHRRARQFLDLPESAHRCAQQEFPATLGPIQQSCIQVCAKYPRRDGIDANPGCRPFDGKRFREGSDGRLAGAVGGNLKERHKGSKRGDVDDAAVALLNHVPAEYAAGAQSSVEIRFHDRIPIGLWNVERRCSLRAAGAIHENLDAAEFGEYSQQEPLDAGVVSHVASQRKRAPTERDNIRSCGSNLLFAAARRYNIGPSLGQSSSDRKPDAAGSADHHRRSVSQIKKRMRHETLLRFAIAPSTKRSARSIVVSDASLRTSSLAKENAQIARVEALICDGQFDKRGGGDACAAVGGLVYHSAGGPLRGGDVVYFAAQLGDVEAALRVGFIQADQVRHDVGIFARAL